MKRTLVLTLIAITIGLIRVPSAPAETAADYNLIPPFVTAGVPPLVMLVLGRDHKLYYEAYNDASDLNGDGTLDVGYRPTIDYYGYFDTHKCYTYSSAQNRFEPTSPTETKKCSGTGEWGGDYLNYLTTSRMDAMRKVLYGGYRSVDTSTETVLERVFIPQDAHTWGKEYESIQRDGFDIREYSPLDLPNSGTRHLFASTTLANDGAPLLRMMTNNTHRIWEWVSKERPVADGSLVSAGGQFTAHPNNHLEFEDMVIQFAAPSHEQGSGTPADGRIDGSGNPFGGDDYYITVFTGELLITTGGDYQFAVDGDDAVEVIIDGTTVAGWYGGHGKCGCQDHDGTITLAAGAHSVEFRQEEVTGGDNYYLWWKGPDSTEQSWEIVPAAHYRDLTMSVYDKLIGASTITDYQARVRVCVNSGDITPESNCKKYPSGVYKPIGLLQKHGESERMYFGLMTGSHAKNTSGGVVRKNVGPITDEINSDTGQITAVNGIIQTINKLRTVGYDYSSYSYNQNCGWITTHPIQEGQCRMWGNPIAEMMYETLRYFAGESGATADFLYSGTTDDATLGLPLASWQDPYDPGTGYSYCAKPFMIVISDINPSFDTDQLPGSSFGSFSGSFGSLDVTALTATISSSEQISGTYFIGDSQASTPNSDSSCSPKTVTGLDSIRGLCPEDPTKQGGYYSSAVAYYGQKDDLRPNDPADEPTYQTQVATLAVAMASPLPQIDIPVGSRTISFVPFAKSVGGYSISTTRGAFQPTNTIVDLYVDTITPTHGKFRINFEDVEQGADHDMDAIVVYQYQVLNDAGEPVTDPAQGAKVGIRLTSEYAAGSIIQHLGYIISGSSADGTYLEVRDVDTGSASDPDYFLDTPPGIGPNQGAGDTQWDDDQALPLDTYRVFTPGTTGSAALLKNPLWYAAKWGGFEDINGNHLPDLRIEWDKDLDDIPDTYYYVNNPTRFEEQMNRSFSEILRRTSSGTEASVISSSRSGEGAVYQAVFYPIFRGPLGNTVSWAGEVHALLIDAYGNMREDTCRENCPSAGDDGTHRLDVFDDLIIEFSPTFVGTIYKYRDSNGNGELDPMEKYQDTNGNGRIDSGETTPNPFAVGTMRNIEYLWDSSAWLNEMTENDVVEQRAAYLNNEQKRFLFTFIDQNQSMIPEAGGSLDDSIDDTGELVTLTHSVSAIFPYLHVYPPFGSSAPAYIEGIRQNYATAPAPFDDFVQRQSARVIDYIRGQDQVEYTSSTSPAYTIPAFRGRQVDYDEDGTVETWRLGDVVYSTPTIVGEPAEDLDLLYRDLSYADFFRIYRNRRNVVYVGANDGMLHAFNAGFFDPSRNKFWRAYGSASGYSDGSGPLLGAELWGYVPYNLLPHLYWLTERDHTEQSHIYYVDEKPRVFDAKIFTPDITHVNGWGTVLVCGMRFGGGRIRADLDKTDGLSYNPEVDRAMSSAFIIMDITNPESPPRLLAEVTAPDLGFTTSYPAVLAMKDKDPAVDPNNWYLVLGSGPIGTNGADAIALADAVSTRTAKLFLLDLKKLATDHEIVTLDQNGMPHDGVSVFAALEDNAFIGNPVAVDYDLDYRADALYFGTVSGNYTNGWSGKLRRIVIDNDADPAHWIKDNTLIDLSGRHDGQPITAAPAVAMDSAANRWVFFGTGRFFNRQDATNQLTAADQESFYGIKEPMTTDPVTHAKSFTWAAVAPAKLLDVSDAVVYEGGTTVDGVAGVADFGKLKQAVQDDAGWLLDFATAGERNLGQATILGDILTFTTYMPSLDACRFEGESYLYALYYGTGTAYTQSVIGLGTRTVTQQDGTQAHEVLKTRLLGRGVAITPNIHTGREQGSKAYVQSSTGEILEIHQLNPSVVKSGKASWEEWWDNGSTPQE